MPPPPLPEANRTRGNGPSPDGVLKPIGAYTPSIVSTYISRTGTSEPLTSSMMTTCSGSSRAAAVAGPADGRGGFMVVCIDSFLDFAGRYRIIGWGSHRQDVPAADV